MGSKSERVGMIRTHGRGLELKQTESDCYFAVEKLRDNPPTLVMLSYMYFPKDQQLLPT